MRATIAVLGLLLLVATSHAQLVEGDIIVASAIRLTHIDSNAVATMAVPVATDGNTISSFSFGNGSVLALSGTDIVLYAQGSSPFNVYRLDFGSSISAPSSTLIGSTGGSNLNMAYDPGSDVAYVLTGTGDVRTISAPAMPGATIAPTAFATGQSGVQAIEVVSGGALVGTTLTDIVAIASGATGLAPSSVTLGGAGASDLAYDESSNRIFVARNNLNRIDTYDLGSGMLLGSPLTSPQLIVTDSVAFDPGSNRVFAMSRIAPTIGGSSWGGGGIANAVICVTDGAGSSTAVGCSPMSGYGNNGVNSFMTVVTSQSLRIDFDSSASTLNFNAGTLTATGVVTSVQNLGPITSPGVDPLVGSTVMLTASYTGSDFAQYSDIVLSNVVIDLFQTAPPPGTPDVSVTSTASSNDGASTFFGGPRNATPLSLRRFQLTTPAPTTSGGTSASLATFTDLITAGGRTTFDFDTANGGLSSIGVNLNLQGASYETRVATSGNGDLEVGTLGAGPFTVLFHIATPMTVTPTGSGPFLGLAPDPLLISQLSSPFGAEPFFVLADADGTYNFFLPGGSIPPGLSLDYLGIQYDVPAVTVTLFGPRTVTF